MAWVPLTHPGVRATPGLLVRAEGDIGQTAVAVRSRILGVGGVRYAEVTPMSEFVGRQMRTWRIGALVFSLFGLIAPAVAAVGLYGVLAYDVTQRQREIGIRIALGASRGAVVGRVLLGALATIGVGVAAGLLFSAWGARWLEALLFEVSPREPAVFALAAGALALITLAAAALPAWRAARVDPRESLAAE
jgi:ABC-type antimicrobial peptide transport system permease subunit